MKNFEEFIISLQNLWLVLDSQAGPVEILRGIDLDVSRGESVVVSGHSGAGKTSLMMIIGGMEKPTKGKVQVAGYELNQLDEDGLAKYRRNNVGIIFQSFHLIPTMTALENVAIPLELSGIVGARGRAEAELVAVGLKERMNHFPSQLSGGEQQRVAIARALISEPDVILADEPTGNLDQANSQKIMQLLFEKCDEKNATLILITHQTELTQSYQRHVELSDGRIVSSWV